MKKILMIAVMAVAAVSANAQYTPQKGDFGTQVSFRPFGSANSSDDATIKLDDDFAIVGRYMVTDQDAIRAKLGFSWANSSDKTANGTSYNPSSATAIGIAAGYERHFSVNDRLDLYAGAEAGFSTLSTTKENIINGTDGSEQVRKVKNEGGFSSLSIGVFTGANFYIYKKLFVGAEIGFAYAHRSNKDIEVTALGQTVTSESNGASNSLRFYAEPSLSLGWTF